VVKIGPQLVPLGYRAAGLVCVFFALTASAAERPSTTAEAQMAELLAASIYGSPNVDFKNVVMAINFGDTRAVTLADVSFTAATVNTTVNGVTNTAAGDVQAGEYAQKLSRCPDYAYFSFNLNFA
jgi:hypothetical protein